ncbi:MAG: sigma-70 family RNA polymerase sigma factor [Eubacterium sp.]
MVENSRDRQICDNLGLVHSIAHRFLGRGVDYEDLFQAGCIGLIKAVDNFDKERGFALSTYAVPVIMGEIKRLFRDGGAIKVSRALKEKSLYVQGVREKFKEKEEREPTVSELSSLTDIPSEELAEILNILTPIMSLSIDTEDGSSELDIPVDDSDRMFDRISVRQALSTLSKQELLLVKYRFYEGKTQVETACLLGISQVQVSRREKALLEKLKTKLSA